MIRWRGSGQARRVGQRWRCAALAAGVAGLTGGAVAAGGLAWLVAYGVRGALHPPRSNIYHTPFDAGIVDYRGVQFLTADGITLRGWYAPSRNGAAVLLAHGYGDNRVDMLAEFVTLAAQGYGVLGFDLRGHGMSAPALVTLGDRERRDIRAALEFLCAQPDVDPDRVGGIGFSSGGAALACVAADDQRLRVVVLEATFPALRDLLHALARPLGAVGRRAVVWRMRRCGVDVDAVRPVDALPRISPRPVLLIYGDQDTLVPPPLQARMIAAAREPVEVWRVLPARHQNFAEVVPEEYAARLIAFFDGALGRG